MNESEKTVTITWEPPGGGQWQLETVHVPGGQPLLFQELASAGFKQGLQAMGKRYGIPIDYLDLRWVNDHCYARMRPVGAPEPKRGKPSGPPPAIVMKALTRLHPELRRRAKAAARMLAEQGWHDDLARWENELRGDMVARNRALQAEPVDQITDAELIAHLRRVADHFTYGCAIHFELVPVHNVPVGRLLLGCRRWGIDDREALGLMSGASPASRASTGALAAIATACRAAGVEPASLEDVRSASPEASRLLEEYLADHAWRVVTEYTPRGRALIEQPDVLVQAIRVAVRTTGEDRVVDPEPVRRRVPDADRAEFDSLLADARRCYGIRDDNVALTMVWPIGLLRRAVLETGRRLVERGLLADPVHALALNDAELAAALAGDAEVASLAARRVARIAEVEASGPPPRLGDPEGPPPDPSVFPPAMADMVRIIFATLALEMPTGVELRWSGDGVGVGTAAYRGRACVAASPEEALARLEPGDILVTTITTPAFEAVMPIAGAVVTEQGGLLGHTAIVCREYGIPAVVGVAGATTNIADGAEVTVDPITGRVEIAVHEAQIA